MLRYHTRTDLMNRTIESVESVQTARVGIYTVYIYTKSYLCCLYTLDIRRGTVYSTPKMTD